MRVIFPFEKQQTKIFGVMRRPIADVLFWSENLNNWIPVKMIVDTGADYTLLPIWIAQKLGVNLQKDCRRFSTRGVGGSQLVLLAKNGRRVKLGSWENKITLGFLRDNDIPPLLGRLHFLERLKVTFENFETKFET